jgi:hypothetical protein
VLWRGSLPGGDDEDGDGVSARAVPVMLVVALVALQALANAMLARGGVP